MHWLQAFSKRRIDRLRAPLSLLLLAMLPAPAHAIGVCSVSTAGAAFGGYSYSSPAPTVTAGNIQVSCSLIGTISLLISYHISLGTGGSGAYDPRMLSSSSNHLQYNLYTNAAHTVVWGDGNSNTSTVSDGYLLGIGTTVRNYSVYGRLGAGQNQPAGIYADTITVTVNY